MSGSGKEANDWYSLQERALRLSDQAFKNLVGEYEEQIRSLRFEISSRDKKVLDLNSKLELANKQVNALKAEKSELRSLLDALEAESRSRDSRMEEICQAISEIKGEQEQTIAKLERCLSKFGDACYASQEFNKKASGQLSSEMDESRSLLSEQCENIEIKEIPNMLVSEAIHYPHKFIADSRSGADSEQNHALHKAALEDPIRGDIVHYSVNKSGVWNRISQVLPSDSYFSLLNFVRQFHLGLMGEEELQTEIQNVLLSNNEAVRNAFTKDILHLSSK